jgi:hypothetical protein
LPAVASRERRLLEALAGLEALQPPTLTAVLAATVLLALVATAAVVDRRPELRQQETQGTLERLVRLVALPLQAVATAARERTPALQPQEVTLAAAVVVPRG